MKKTKKAVNFLDGFLLLWYNNKEWGSIDIPKI